MALFNMKNIDIKGAENKEEIAKLKSHLFQLNEQLQYMFANLDPKENYSKGAYIRYQEEGDKVASLEFSVDGIKSTIREGNERMSRIEQNASNISLSVNQANERISNLSVSVEGVNARVSNVDGRVSQLQINTNNILLSYARKNEVVSLINLSQEGVKIRGDKIQLEGTVTANGNVQINPDGTLHARNGTFTGTIHAHNGTFTGNINGSTINTSHLTSTRITGDLEVECGGNFIVRSGVGSNDYLMQFGHFESRVDGGTHVFASADSQFLVNDTGEIHAQELYLHRPSIFYGRDGRHWSLGETIQDLYNRLQI